MKQLISLLIACSVFFACSSQGVPSVGTESAVTSVTPSPSSPEMTINPSSTIPSATHSPTKRPSSVRPEATAQTVRGGSRQHSLRGIASWGPFGGHVVTRLPRGTSITIIGPLGRWSGLSWGYGPAKWTNRIADLDVTVFENVCGPRSIGLCKVTLIWR